MTITKAKQDLVKSAQRAYRRGIQTGNGGNISVRVPGQEWMVVKPSGISFVECTEENLVVTDYDGKVVEGTLKPTREALLHGVLYKNVPWVNGIVHTHSPWTIAWSYTRKDVPLITQHSIGKIGPRIATLLFESFKVTGKEVPDVLGLFQEHPETQAFVLLGHGIVALGKDVLEAEHTAELVEETAQIAWLHEIGKGLNIIQK
jgi:L-ribulose-5-phosphate 4-epimerase